MKVKILSISTNKLVLVVRELKVGLKLQTLKERNKVQLLFKRRKLGQLLVWIRRVCGRLSKWGWNRLGIGLKLIQDPGINQIVFLIVVITLFGNI